LGRLHYARFLTPEYIEEVAPALDESAAFTTLAWGVTED
jgi:hypothetical protein